MGKSIAYLATILAPLLAAQLLQIAPLYAIDAGFFHDGYGMIGGDIVKVGPKTSAKVTAVDYGAGTITLDTPMQMGPGVGIALFFSGSAPNMGAWDGGLLQDTPDIHPPLLPPPTHLRIRPPIALSLGQPSGK